MTLLTDLLITAGLAIAFAAVGETALRARSRDLVSWNQSFLVGMACCAALLFPLSLLLPRHALDAELTLMGGSVLLVFVRRARHPDPAVPRPPAPPTEPLTLALLAAAALVALEFTAVNLRYSFWWDGFQIWASKAQLLYDQGALGRSWYPGDGYDRRLVVYPPLVPLYEALLQVVRGRFDFDSFKPVFLPFYYSLLVATYGAARAVASARLAAAATMLLALIPLNSARYAAGGYADMPQAALVAGVVAAGLRAQDSRRALPWLIGGLTVVKPEGTIIALVAVGAVGLFWLMGTTSEAAFSWRGILVVAIFLMLRFGYLRWVGAVDSVYVVSRESLATAVARVPHVARLCLVKLLSPRRWGLFWPAFGLAALVLARRGTLSERILALATVVAAFLFAAIFLFTTWPLDLHIDQAYQRLLGQISPAAAVAIVAGFNRVHLREGADR